MIDFYVFKDAKQYALTMSFDDGNYDESMVYNPTAEKIWFVKDGTVYSINPGEQINF